MSNLIYKKMSDVMKEIGYVGKDQKNTAQGFKFRGIDQFVNALYPALTKHGVFMAPRATSYTQELKEVIRGSGKPGIDKHVSMMVEYDFWAEDGSKVTVGPVPAEGLDSGDKATNKALSAALKYALIQTFSVPTEDMAEADFESPVIAAPAKTWQQTKPTVDMTKTTGVEAAPVVTASGSTTTPPITTVAPKKTSSFRNKAKPTTTNEVLAKETDVPNDWQ